MIRKSIFLIVFFYSSILFSQQLYDIDTIRDFKLYFYDANWRVKLNEFKKNNSNKRVIAKLIVDKVIYDSVGVKFKGNSSYSAFYVKNPMNIKLDYKIKKQNLKGKKTIKLSNIFRDPSGIREVLAYKIIGNYMPTPKANFVQVFINDSLIGLYTNTEIIDKSFAKKHYAYKNSAFFKCENNSMEIKPKNCDVVVPDGLLIGFTLDSNCYTGKYELQSKYGWNELLNLMMTLWYNADDTTKYYHQIDKVLDIDKVMWMLAFNNLFVNLDSYSWSGRNYYMCQDTNKLFHTIMWDMNMCFGGFSHGYPTSKLTEFPVFSCEDNIYRPLISKLFLVPEYKQLYINHYITLLKKEMLNGKFDKEVIKLYQQITPFIKNDPYFYYKGISFENALNQTYKNEIPGILQLMQKRLKYLKTIPELKAAFN